MKRTIRRPIVGMLAAASILLAAPVLAIAATQTVNVRSQPDVFDDARLTIAVGDTVTWVVAPGTVHTVTSGTYNASGVQPDGLFDSGSMAPGEDFAFTFTAAGEFPYVCTIHADAGMVGRIIVVDASVPEPIGEGSDGIPSSVAVVALIVGAMFAIGVRLWASRRA